MTQVLICGAAIVTLSMGIRHGFGLWLQPITHGPRLDPRDLRASRSRSRTWPGAWPAPFAGMLADRFGAFRVLVVGSRALRRRAWCGMGAGDHAALAFTGSAGVLIGMAQAGTTYAVDLRRDRPQRRARASAAGRWASPRRPARSASS